MTNLTNKIETLATRLDTVIARLDTSNTKLGEIVAALTAGGGNVDVAPIVTAIAELRGSGPENTLRSLNQSIWNLAGPAPGRSLTEIYTEVAALKANVGLPTGDATTTLLGLLASLQYALSTNNPATLYGLLWNVEQTLTLPGTIDRTVLEELELIRIGTNLTNTALNPPTIPTTPPPGSTNPCASPYSSTGQSVGSSIAAFLGQTVTYAQWSGTPPAGITIGTAYVTSGDTLHSDDWSQYSIYVSSRAPTFGVQGTSAQRFNTNTWVVLSGSEDFVFFVDGNFALTVTICGEGITVEGELPLSFSLTTELVGGEYSIVWPQWSNVESEIAIFSGRISLVDYVLLNGYYISAPSHYRLRFYSIGYTGYIQEEYVTVNFGVGSGYGGMTLTSSSPLTINFVKNTP